MIESTIKTLKLLSPDCLNEMSSIMHDSVEPPGLFYVTGKPDACGDADCDAMHRFEATGFPDL